jgi:hypothetical protein
MRGLIVDEIALGRARQSLKIVPARDIAAPSDTGARPRRAPERVARRLTDRVEQRADLPPLMLTQARVIQRLERGVEHAISRAA